MGRPHLEVKRRLLIVPTLCATQLRVYITSIVVLPWRWRRGDVNKSTSLMSPSEIFLVISEVLQIKINVNFVKTGDGVYAFKRDYCKVFPPFIIWYSERDAELVGRVNLLWLITFYWPNVILFGVWLPCPSIWPFGWRLFLLGRVLITRGQMSSFKSLFGPNHPV